MLATNQLKSVIPVNIQNNLRHFFVFQPTKKSKNIQKELVSKNFLTKEEIQQYKQELKETKIVYELLEKEQEVINILQKEHTEKGNKYKAGIMNPLYGVYLYSVIRKLQPEIAVETGVCNGFSTTYSLLALHKNNKGKLYSIDFPRLAGIDYQKGTFLEQLEDQNHTMTERVSKDTAAIPKHQQSGWVIPEYLKQRWELILGKSQEKLPELLARLGEIDYFMHDSEHTYECMWFEFNEAYKFLREGGIIISDDITWNDSFPKFAAEKGKTPIYIGPRLGFFIK